MMNFYTLLEVSETASLEEIERAFFQKRKKWSKQASNSPSVETRRDAEDNLARVGEIEAVFSSEQSRANYDALLSKDNERKKNTFDKRDKNQTSHANNTEDEIAAIWNLFISGDQARAIAEAFGIKNSVPHDRRILTMLIAGYTRSGAYDAGVLVSGEALMLYPDDSDIGFYTGLLYKEMKEWKKAFRAFGRACETAAVPNAEYLSEYMNAALNIDEYDLVVSTLEPRMKSLCRTNRKDVFKYCLCYAYLGKLNQCRTVVQDSSGSDAYYYTSKQQILTAEKLLAKAKRLKCSSLAEKIESQEQHVATSKSRRFCGSKASIGIGVVMGFIINSLCGGDRVFGAFAALGSLMMWSSVFYFISSFTKVYAINRRIFTDGAQMAVLDNSVLPIFSGGFIGWCAGCLVLAVAMPVFAVINFVRNFIIDN